MPTYLTSGSSAQALEAAGRRGLLPTHLSSRQIREQISADARRRAVFSARTTRLGYLARLRDQIGALLSGEHNEARAREILQGELDRLGYDPQRGFPGDAAGLVPPAPRGSLRDLASTSRLELVLKTQQRQARAIAQAKAGGAGPALEAYPAWRLERYYLRMVERPDWLQRWQAAGTAVAWDGAAQDQLLALKSSPIWQALGDGLGGYTDTLGNPFPPFAFGSGLSWSPVPRADAEALGLIAPGETAAGADADLSPGESEIDAALSRLGTDFQRALLEALT